MFHFPEVEQTAAGLPHSPPQGGSALLGPERQRRGPRLSSQAPLLCLTFPPGVWVSPLDDFYSSPAKTLPGPRTLNPKVCPQLTQNSPPPQHLC